MSDKTSEQRLAQAHRIRTLFKKLPVLVHSKTLVFKKEVYLCDPDTTAGRLIFKCRSNLHDGSVVGPADGLYMFTGDNALVRLHSMVGELDSTYKTDDGFLHLWLEKESTFGGI